MKYFHVKRKLKIPTKHYLPILSIEFSAKFNSFNLINAWRFQGRKPNVLSKDIYEKQQHEQKTTFNKTLGYSNILDSTFILFYK